MTWSVAYWEGRVVFRASTDYLWSDLPTEGVLWVDVRRGGYHHRLVGMDNYWLHGDSFGVFNDPSNWAWYGGGPEAQYVAWRWVGGGSERIDPSVPEAAHVLRGVLVPDEIAWELGLLDRGEHLPPRPGGA